MKRKSFTSFRNKSWDVVFFDFVVKFINGQPPEYALGFEIYEKRVGWWDSWTVQKNLLGDQIGIQNNNKKMDKEKQNWLYYMQQNYKYINKEESEKLYAAVFHREINKYSKQ